MIVKMKKTTVLCLIDEKRDALEKLASLGVLHLDLDEVKDSDDRKTLEQQYEDTVKIVNVLSAIDKFDEGENEFSGLNGRELSEKISDLLVQKSDLNKKLDNLNFKKSQLLPWGNFSPELLTDLREKGMNIYLCVSMKSSFKMPHSEDMDKKISYLQKIFADKTALNSEDIIIKIVRENKRNIWFALISSENINEDLLPIDDIPPVSLKNVKKELQKARAELEKIKNDLAKLAFYSEKVELYASELEEKLEFATASDSMGEAESIVYIDGYTPVSEVENLKKAAEENGWGVMLRDPKADDTPPTLIKTPKIFEISKPIFDFIGISPGYKEWDVSTCFLLFFTIFFGIIVGDAGYGLIFLILSILAKIKFRRNKKMQLPIKLFILLSCSTIIWGFLNGTVFAIPSEHLPPWMRGVNWFTDPSFKDQHIQQLCFLIAAIHLSFGHLWKAVLYINSRKAPGEIGWAMLLWGNYFTALNLIVYPDRPWPITLLVILYVPGVIFVSLCAINWKVVSGLFDFFFGIIGTFVDLLSYIRLFAVGLSSYYIAVSFNDMGLMILKDVDNKFVIALLIIPAILIIIGGHLLNIILALLAVLVHGIRLNTLEFSNHMSLQWLGHVYKPFKKKNSDVTIDDKG